MAILLKHPRMANGDPLHLVEEILTAAELETERQEDGAVTAELDGNWYRYRLCYRWDASMSLLLFDCVIELHLTPAQRQKLYPLLARINEKLWLGHFVADHEEGNIHFRRNIMIEHTAQTNSDKIDFLLDVAISECDRCYPAIQAVLWQGKTADEALQLALFETVGEA